MHVVIAGLGGPIADQGPSSMSRSTTSNGFDAVDLDIEDGPWSAIGPPNPAMTTCIEAISNAAHAKGLFLSEDVITNWQGPWLAPSKDYVDQYQLMTFGDNLSQMQADVQQTINQGLPASKFIVGVDVADYAPPSGGCGQFATYAAQAGLKGTFVWTTRADSDNGNACANGLAASSGPPPPGPAVTLTPAGLTFASQTVGTTSSAQTSTLQNTGTAPLTISSIATGGTNATDFAQTNNCPTSPSTLAAGASCTISVTFTPGASGSRSGTVVITDNAPGSPHALTLSGTGAATPFNWAANASSDFDGDHITDLGGLYRGRTPLDSLWYAPASSANGAFQIYFGATTDVPVPGDYDGDGKTDAVIFRPNSGLWYGPRTGAAQIVIQMMLGQAGDIPVPGDYDGDGKTDPAIYRPSTGLFFAVLSAGGTLGTMWGGQAGDIPVPRDWDGDGKTDVAIYRPSTGQWSAKLSGGGTYQVINGAAGDVPVPADYNGDRRADPVVWRPSTGKWTGPYNGATGSYANTLGQTGDIPIPGYYDNNKKVDPAIWRPSTGLWFAALSGGGTKSMAGLGAAGDVPVQRRPALAG